MYGSTGGGQTWKLLISNFEFKSLFIHPGSGELFTIIQDNIIAPRADGFLTVQHFEKAVVSKDGKQWKDITGQQQRIAGLLRIAVDPVHPNRVRIEGVTYKVYFLIAVDDDFSAWTQYFGATF